ncbi:MAG: hypothetical protein ACTSQY_11000 [Candidatus Odinarchaeia archaeon]
MKTFQKLWVTRKEYKDAGAGVIHTGLTTKLGIEMLLSTSSGENKKHSSLFLFFLKHAISFLN